MSNYLSNSEARELLAEGINLFRLLNSNLDNARQNINLTIRFRQIGKQLQNYIHPINYSPVPVKKIPLKVRYCFVRSIMLHTRYSKIVDKTGGTYKSPIIDSYQIDTLPNSWQKINIISKLCQLFELPPNYAQKIECLLTKVDQKIARQKQIIEALINEFNQVTCQRDVLSLFQNLFGDLPIPKESIDCLTTKMQISFIIDYKQDRLRDKSLWSNLSNSEQQNITLFLKKISQFSWQQFTNFPSFGYLEAKNINSVLLKRLVNITGYSKSQITKAIATSITIVPTNRAESFLLHDLWGHYWQSILTQFDIHYDYLGKLNRHLTFNSTVEIERQTVYLSQIFKVKNNVITLDKSLAKSFFHHVSKKRLDSLSVHLIGEMLADINEYKWILQNPHLQELLLSSSYFKDYPTKLDLTLKDILFLYLPIFESLIKLPQSPLKLELADKFQLEDRDLLSSLVPAIAELNQVFLTEYIDRYQLIINRHQKIFSNLLLNLLRLQNLLNTFYLTCNDKNYLPLQDLVILFVSNYYVLNYDLDLRDLNLVLANYWFPCCLLLNRVDTST